MAMSILLKTMMNKNMNRVIKNISQVTEELKLCLKLNSKNSLDFDFMHIHLAICSRYPTYLLSSLVTVSQRGHGVSSPLSLLLFPRDAHKDRSPRLPLPLSLPLSRASSLSLLLRPVSPLQPAQFPTHQEGIVSKGRTEQKKTCDFATIYHKDLCLFKPL
jgi:hypothetical protein